MQGIPKERVRRIWDETYQKVPGDASLDHLPIFELQSINSSRPNKVGKGISRIKSSNHSLKIGHAEVREISSTIAIVSEAGGEGI